MVSPNEFPEFDAWPAEEPAQHGGRERLRRAYEELGAILGPEELDGALGSISRLMTDAAGLRVRFNPPLTAVFGGYVTPPPAKPANANLAFDGQHRLPIRQPRPQSGNRL